MSQKTAWWWLALGAVPPLVAIATTSLAPEPSGHWTEHLASVGLKTAQLIVLIVLLVRARRLVPPVMLVAVGLGVLGMAMQALGDLDVAQSLWRTTGDRGFGPGYESGHNLTGMGDLVVLVAGVGFALGGAFTRALPRRHAALAGFLAFIPPPFLWPGVGILYGLLLAITRRRSLRHRGA